MADKIGSVLELAIANRPFNTALAYAKAPPQPSENWERNALSTILWLMVWKKLANGVPAAFDTLDEIAAWYPKQDFCGSEDFARIYSGYNVSSAVAAREAFRRLGHATGADFMARWCRAMAGYVALGSGWGPGKNVDFGKLAAVIAPNRPQLVRSDPNLNPNPATKGAPAFVLPGDRSFAHNGLGWLTASGVCSLPHLVLGDQKTFLACSATHNVFRELVKVGADISLLTAEESVLARRAMIDNDPEAALRIAREWLPQVPWTRDRFLIVRRDTGVEAARLYGSEAPTAQLDYASWQADTRELRFLAVNDAYREDWIMSSAVETSAPDFARFRAFTDNPQEKGVHREIACDGLAGEVRFAFAFGGDEPPRFLVPDEPFELSPPAPEPGPTPPPSGTKPKKSDRTLLYAGAALLAVALILAFTC